VALQNATIRSRPVNLPMRSELLSPMLGQSMAFYQDEFAGRLTFTIPRKPRWW
jgi:hypothetical protein